MSTERGRNELAKGGYQNITPIELPLTNTDAAPGLVIPGRLEVQDTLYGTSGDWRALCLSASIRAESGKVTQSIVLERHF